MDGLGNNTIPWTFGRAGSAWQSTSSVTPCNKLSLSHMGSGGFTPINKPISLTDPRRGHSLALSYEKQKGSFGEGNGGWDPSKGAWLALHGNECWCWARLSPSFWGRPSSGKPLLSYTVSKISGSCLKDSCKALEKKRACDFLLGRSLPSLWGARRAPPALLPLVDEQGPQLQGKKASTACKAGDWSKTVCSPASCRCIQENQRVNDLKSMTGPHHLSAMLSVQTTTWTWKEEEATGQAGDWSMPWFFPLLLQEVIGALLVSWCLQKRGKAFCRIKLIH